MRISNRKQFEFKIPYQVDFIANIDGWDFYISKDQTFLIRARARWHSFKIFIGQWKNWVYESYLRMTYAKAYELSLSLDQRDPSVSPNEFVIQ